MEQLVQITILQDNTATRPGVQPAHGLAMLVEMNGQRVLLDTGPDGSVLRNATALGVALQPLRAIVLSHGHNDHGGGLAAVLQAVGPTLVVAHPQVFDRRLAGADAEHLRDIGLPLTREQYEALGARFRLAELPVVLDGGLMTTGRVPWLRLDHVQRAGLWRHKNESMQPDDFRDDISLIARLADCSVVLTGCAHAGVINILCKAQTITPEPPRVLIGGLHLGAAHEAQIQELAQELAEMGLTALLPCHCTGAEATKWLQKYFAGRVVPIGAGSLIRVHEHGDVEVRYPAHEAGDVSHG